MTPKQLEKELRRPKNPPLEIKERIELIEQFKSKWEAESYIKGFKDACNKTKEYLNAPEP